MATHNTFMKCKIFDPPTYYWPYFTSATDLFMSTPTKRGLDISSKSSAIANDGRSFFVPMCSNNRKIGFAQRWAYPKLGSFVLINVIWVSRVRTRNNKYMGIFVRCKVDFLSRQPWRLWILMLGCTLAPRWARLYWRRW